MLFDIDLDDEVASSNDKNNGELNYNTIYINTIYLDMSKSYASGLELDCHISGNCNINDNDVVTCIQILRKRIPWLEEDVIREEINNHGAFLISDYGYKKLPSIRISAYSEDYYYNSELSSNASELNTRTSVMSYKAVAIIDKFIEIGHKKKSSPYTLHCV